MYAFFFEAAGAAQAIEGFIAEAVADDVVAVAHAMRIFDGIRYATDVAAIVTVVSCTSRWC